MKRLATALLGLALVAACADQGPTGPVPDLHRRGGGGPDHDRSGVTVMTRNLYLGADVDPIIAATDPAQIPLLVSQAWATVQATDFAERAGALADEIARARPHLVGLQEVALFRIQVPGDAALGGTTPATAVAIDFLAVLLEALAARGLDYRPVATVQDSDLEVPGIVSLAPLAFFDIRFTDRDVILARGDVRVRHAQGATFATVLPVSVGGIPGAIVRGWTSVETTIRGRSFRFVNTHLETPAAAPVQAGQAAELLAVLNASSLPTLLVGDINSAADGSTTPTYAQLRDAGLVDAWTADHRRARGYTCCQAEDLRNGASLLRERIDVILLRGGRSLRHGRIAGGVDAEVVGDAQRDRTPSGLWPSDHAGVVARFRVPPGT
jgi:endonuclease/exonuclease/phosphatase family metal-dependent hydrolase